MAQKWIIFPTIVDFNVSHVSYFFTMTLETSQRNKIEVIRDLV